MKIYQVFYFILFYFNFILKGYNYDRPIMKKETTSIQYYDDNSPINSVTPLISEADCSIEEKNNPITNNNNNPRISDIKILINPNEHPNNQGQNPFIKNPNIPMHKNPIKINPIPILIPNPPIPIKIPIQLKNPIFQKNKIIANTFPNPKLIKKPVSQIPECSKDCELCNEGKCIKCPKGAFSYLEKCFNNCPGELFADNIDMSCKPEKEKPVFNRAYTISRCVNSCGKDFFDCSCNNNCVKNGSCCSDFKFCQVIENSHTSETKLPNCLYADEQDTVCLQCKENFYYFNNECLLKCPNKNNNKDIIVDKEKNNFGNFEKMKNSEKENLNIIIAYEENKICKEINTSKNIFLIFSRL